MDEYFQSWIWAPDHDNDSFWRSWLAAHPEKVADASEARHLLQQFTFNRYKLPDDDVVNLWKRIQGTEHLPAEVDNRQRFHWWRWAVAAVLIAGLAYIFLPPHETISYSTSYGETKSIVLPDQSEVVLNANSTLSFEDNWDNTSVRAVQLDGEAFFDVKHTVNNQPFTVATEDGVSVEVLGTTFNIYHRTRETKIMLSSGKIQLSLPAPEFKEKIIMKPGELVEFRSNHFSKKSVDPERYLAWTENRLVLDRTSLREMVQLIHNNYGIDVKVTPEQLLDQTVSGSMPAAAGEELVDQIAKAFRLKVVRNADQIIITE